MSKLGGKIKEKLRERKWSLKVKTWVLILILIILLPLDAMLLRKDHIRMTELRDAVLSADVEENDEKMAAALVALKEFVFSNIVVNVEEENGNQVLFFGTGPFVLEHQYIRAATEALEEAEQNLGSDSNPNGNIYGMAGETCKSLAIQNGWTWNSAEYINCMVAEIEKYPSADEIQDQFVASLPSTKLFRKNYASPVWAPTITGFALLITLVIIVVILIRMMIWIMLRLSLLFV